MAFLGDILDQTGFLPESPYKAYAFNNEMILEDFGKESDETIDQIIADAENYRANFVYFTEKEELTFFIEGLKAIKESRKKKAKAGIGTGAIDKWVAPLAMLGIGLFAGLMWGKGKKTTTPIN